MKITAITRYKHGELYAILQRLAWTQSELARQSGLSISMVGLIINLVRRPTVEQADAIQKAVGTAGEYLDVLAEWPETFEGLKRGYKLEQTADVEMENLIGCREAMMLPAPEIEDTAELDGALENVLTDLTPREQAVIKERFWNGKTLDAIGQKYKIGAERIRSIESQALRRLRHPVRLKKLLPHMACEWDTNYEFHEKQWLELPVVESSNSEFRRDAGPVASDCKPAGEPASPASNG